MAGQNTQTFTEANFEQEVLSSDKPVLVDFWATWCPPCVAIAPVIDELATEYVGKAKVGKVDVDANQQLSIKYGVSSIPTLLVFRGGKVTKTIVGRVPKSQLANALNDAASA